MNVRWIVERPNGELEDVGADELHIAEGCLLFRGPKFQLLIGYAPGQWVTVCEERE